MIGVLDFRAICCRSMRWVLLRLCLVVSFVLLLSLAACGPLAETPRPTAAPALLVAPTMPPVGPLPTVVAAVTLPGRLLFARDGDLWLWQGATGKALTQRRDLSQPSWSPDGTRIACVRRGESYSDIVLLSATGEEIRPLTKHTPASPLHSYERIYEGMWAFYPAFAPDNSELLFAAQAAPPVGSPAAETNLSLFNVSTATGSAATPLFASETGNIGRAAYAPDGDTIVFAHAPTDQSAPQLWRYNRMTDEATPLPNAPQQSYDPVFSADGRWLAFAARTESGTDIFAVSAAGGAPVRLTNVGTARAPAFAPDGTQLAFLAVAPGEHQFDLWVLNLTPEADGLRAGQPRQITQNVGIDADSGLSWGK